MTTPAELLTAAAIAAMPGKAKAHLLNPEATRVSKSLGAATGLSALGFHMMTVPPGSASALAPRPERNSSWKRGR